MSVSLVKNNRKKSDSNSMDSLRSSVSVLTSHSSSYTPKKIIFNQEEGRDQWSQDSKLAYPAHSFSSLSYEYLKSLYNLSSYTNLQDAAYYVIPHFSLYQKNHNRIEKYISSSGSSTSAPNYIHQFEAQIDGIISGLIKNDALEVKELAGLLDHLIDFEKHLTKPFIFNFEVSFSPSFVEKLLCLYSVFFHVRCLMAVEHNTGVKDFSYETVRCDSITDYLPHAEYLANDAIFCNNFRKAIQKYTQTKPSGFSEIEKNLLEPLHMQMSKYMRNSGNLIENLPEKLMASYQNQIDENKYYQIQMDWLLGTSAGVLFRLREEIFGLLRGYEKIFWHLLDGESKKPEKSFQYFSVISSEWIKPSLKKLA